MSIKNLVCSAVVLLGVAATLPLQAAPCLAQTANLYTTACNIGLLTFSNFQFIQTSSGSVTPAPLPPTGGLPTNDVLITPLIDANGTGFMLTPTVPWGATSGGITDLEFSYVVTSNLGGPRITNIFQSIAGAVTDGAFDNITENYCPGGTTLPPASPCPGFGVTTPQLFTRLNAPGGTATSVTAPFSALSVAVLKDISADARIGGTATITAVKNQFGPAGVPGIPEPGTYVLSVLGAGLIGCAQLLRRRSHPAR